MNTRSRTSVTAIVQARMASTRLPGKSLIDVCGQPLLWRVLERIRRSVLISGIVIATTTADEDGAIAALAELAGLPCFRGSSADVLDRFYWAARVIPTDIVVRITADDPLKDAELIDSTIEVLLRDGNVHYASNTLVPTFPEGLDVEVFTVGALKEAWANATLPSEREHVTPYIWKNPQLFNARSVEGVKDLSGMRWTVDYAEDLEFVRQVYNRLRLVETFGWRDVLKLIEDEPTLASINTGIARNAGYLSSVAQENATS